MTASDGLPVTWAWRQFPDWPDELWLYSSSGGSKIANWYEIQLVAQIERLTRKRKARCAAMQRARLAERHWRKDALL